MKQFFLLIVLGFVCASAANAQVATNPCEDEQNQSNMNLCSYQQYMEADAELNKTWKKLMSVLDPVDQGKMKEMERMWIKLRDQHCELQSSTFEGGSMQPLIRNTCLREFTIDRTEQLQDLIETFDN